MRQSKHEIFALRNDEDDIILAQTVMHFTAQTSTVVRPSQMAADHQGTNAATITIVFSHHPFEHSSNELGLQMELAMKRSHAVMNLG